MRRHLGHMDLAVSPAQVVVNTAIYQHGTSGTATATRELVEALRAIDAIEVTEAAPPRGTGRAGRGSMRNAWADARWDLRGAARSLPRVDLLVSPCNIGRRGQARRHLLVVHDVMAIDHPELFDRKFAAWFRLLVPWSVRSADRVLTLSPRTAERIRAMSPDVDVRVVSWSHPGGASPRVQFGAVSGRPTVLMVGASEPVKNQVAGVQAVALLRESTGCDVALRVVGPAGRSDEAVREALVAVDPANAWTSREVDVPAGVLERAYGTAWVLLQPSLDEGFGLPLVEAARHGLPAVHSGRGSMPTVLPEVDAHGVTPAALAGAMAPLLHEPRWQHVADAAAVCADAFSPEAFRAAVAEHVEDLLPVRT